VLSPALTAAAAVRRAGAEVSVGTPQLLADLLDRQLARRLTTTRVVEALAIVTVALAVLGLYGLLSLSVATRRRESGVRLALGESPGAAARRVVAGGLAHVVSGLAVGLGLATASGRLVASLLVDVSAVDVPTMLEVSLACLAMALFATALPARRAAAIDPAEVLRE
jgi:putative ABC transport system permease protein